MNNNNSTTETYREEEFESPLGIKNLTISSSLSNNSTLLSKKSNSLRSNKSVKYQPQQQQQQPQSQPQPHQQLQQGEDQNNNISDADQLQFHQVDTQRQQLSKQFKMLNLGQQLNDDQELITEPVQQQAVQAEVRNPTNTADPTNSTNSSDTRTISTTDTGTDNSEPTNTTITIQLK
ncbi:unnamed protein product [[Candida] boidinii]|nr:unnamed protein product [[Candida] boidinii]